MCHCIRAHVPGHAYATLVHNARAQYSSMHLPFERQNLFCWNCRQAAEFKQYMCIVMFRGYKWLLIQQLGHSFLPYSEAKGGLVPASGGNVSMLVYFTCQRHAR